MRWKVVLSTVKERVPQLKVLEIVLLDVWPPWSGVCAEQHLSIFFFFFTLVTGPRRSWSLKLSDERFYEPQLRARLITTAHVLSHLNIVMQPCKRARLSLGLDPGMRGGLSFE